MANAMKLHRISQFFCIKYLPFFNHTHAFSAVLKFFFYPVKLHWTFHFSELFPEKSDIIIEEVEAAIAVSSCNSAPSPEEQIFYIYLKKGGDAVVRGIHYRTPNE